jgi:raffinose/stachyose/melibiose transport system substrate-binding protein
MKKLLALLLMVALMTSLFVGCGQTETDTGNSSGAASDAGDTTNDTSDSDESESSEATNEVELRIVTMFGGTDPSTEVFEQQLKDFMDANPNVTIINESMTSVGDEFRTAVKTDFSTGNEADVTFFYTGADAKGIIESGSVVPYEEVRETYPEVGGDISESILDSVREFDGKLYALPMTGFYEGLFVNTELFDQYDLELPTSWENLTTAIEVLSENGITPIAGPIAQSHYLIEHFVLAQAGVEGHQDVLDGDIPQSWVDGLTHIKELHDMNAFSADAIAMEIEASQNLFRQGNAAMIFEGSWFIGGCDEELQAKMTVMPMPTAPGGAKDPTSIVAGYSSGYYISRRSYDDASKQEVVVDLVKHLTSAEAIKEIAAANGGTPSAPVTVEGLSQVALDGHKMAAEAKGLSMPIDSRLKPEAFNYIVKEGVPFIAFGERTALEVLEEVKNIQSR